VSEGRLAWDQGGGGKSLGWNEGVGRVEAGRSLAADEGGTRRLGLDGEERVPVAEFELREPCDSGQTDGLGHGQLAAGRP